VQDVAKECNISAMPTFQVFQDGKFKEELVGASRDGLEKLVMKYAS
jgi:hypothetical protein